MSDQIFNPGEIVQHVHFKVPKLFVVKMLDDGCVRCRYTSTHRSNYATSELQFHFHDFEPFELKLYKEEEESGVGFFFA